MNLILRYWLLSSYYIQQRWLTYHYWFKKGFRVTKHCSWKVVSADTCSGWKNPPIWCLCLYLGWIYCDPKSPQWLNAQRSHQGFHGAHSWWSQLPLAGLDRDLKEVRIVHVNASKTCAMMQLFSQWVSVSRGMNQTCCVNPDQSKQMLRLGNYKPVVLTRT